MVRGPEAGLALLSTLDSDARMTSQHRLHAVRAHLLELAGDASGARASFLEAARRTTSTPERRFLEGRAARLRAADDG
jgi:predicted RNA polymerase sigma factor